MYHNLKIFTFNSDTRNGGQQYRNNNSNGNKSGGSGSSFGSPPPHFATPPHYPSHMHPHHQDMLGKCQKLICTLLGA